MTKRAGKTYPADPHQWYIETRFTIEQAFASLDFGGGIIWDPSCGTGNILNVARELGHLTIGTDIVDRAGRDPVHAFRVADFRRLRSLPFRPPPDKMISLFCNPPYGKVKGVGLMGEKFVKHALDRFADDCFRLAFVVPIEFLASEGRYWDIYKDRRPSHVLICCQRPSMPPGVLVEELGAKAFKGGMADYCIVVWTGLNSERTETIFMRPQDSTRPASMSRRVR